MAYFVLMCR